MKKPLLDIADLRNVPLGSTTAGEQEPQPLQSGLPGVRSDQNVPPSPSPSLLDRPAGAYDRRVVLESSHNGAVCPARAEARRHALSAVQRLARLVSHDDPRVAVQAASALLQYASGHDAPEPEVKPTTAKRKVKPAPAPPTEPMFAPPPGPADMTQAEWLSAVVDAWNAHRGARPAADPPSKRTQRRDNRLLTFRERFPDPAEWGDASRALAVDNWHGRMWVDEDNRLRSTLGWLLQDAKGSVELWHERGRAGRRDGWRVHQDPGPAYLSESDKLRRDALEMQRAETQGTLVPITGGRR